ncbi:hypothetical protein NL676_025723 [Syzygium grande]|nr:hypothetical protein NL676_025723 [Syzygium grande]
MHRELSSLRAADVTDCDDGDITAYSLSRPCATEANEVVVVVVAVATATATATTRSFSVVVFFFFFFCLD